MSETQEYIAEQMRDPEFAEAYKAADIEVEHQRLQSAVVSAALRRRRAHEALRESIPQGMPIPICEEYDAANDGYESAVDALIAYEKQHGIGDE